MKDYSNLKNKRIAAIDFGLKRVGLALCDEFHISISTKAVLDFQSEKFWEDILLFLKEENIAAIVVGYPIRNDGKESFFLKELDIFIENLKEKANLEVLIFDESYSSKRAVETMLQIGMKKKNRAKKGNIDKISAAIILRDFLQEME